MSETAIDERALGRLRDAVRNDVEANVYDGAVLLVAHRGDIVLHDAIGWADRDQQRPLETQSVFRILSLTKAFTVATVLQAVDEGLLQLTTRVVDVIPEFRSQDRFLNARRDRISVTELLTHRSAMPPTPLPVPEPRLGNLAEVIEAICRMDAIGEPGAVIDYSPAINHALLGEMVRRVRTVKTFREVVEERVWRPLKMADTALGAPAEWSSRLVPIRAKFSQAGWLTGADIEEMNRTLSPEAEMPWVGAVSTAADVFRFAEMLRRGGEREGARVLSTAVLDRALTNHTGDALNNWWIPMAQRMNWPPMPANLGLGFFLRGAGLHPSILGTLTSAGTFGNYGAGSTLYWVDPARELTFVCLTSGVLEESQNILRFQRLSDLAVSAVVRVNEGA